MTRWHSLITPLARSCRVVHLVLAGCKITRMQTRLTSSLMKRIVMPILASRNGGKQTQSTDTTERLFRNSKCNEIQPNYPFYSLVNHILWKLPFKDDTLMPQQDQQDMKDTGYGSHPPQRTHSFGGCCTAQAWPLNTKKGFQTKA
jgi:hypothetical protein